jgi:hypothetical protein
MRSEKFNNNNITAAKITDELSQPDEKMEYNTQRQDWKSP